MAQTAAVVDVGSNTVRLLVARVGANGLERTYTERVRIGLAHELEATGRISDDRISTTAQTVSRLVDEAHARRAEAIDVFVTAPGRQAENAVELVTAIERAAGRRVRILSADEEARLAFAGALALSTPRTGLVAVVDLGGASTEIAVGRPDRGPDWARSIDLGAGRLTSRLLEHAPPRRTELDAAHAEVAAAFAGVAPPLPFAALAVGGSARALGRVFGETLERGEFSAAVSILARTHPDEIARRCGVGNSRAPLLLAASLILAEVQRRLLVPLQVSEGGVREGALLAVAREAAAA
jgi:exopolyphosphatase/guanosine-5'-triphosphate,3'-diphosphate pyrophosphatase